MRNCVRWFVITWSVQVRRPSDNERVLSLAPRLLQLAPVRQPAPPLPRLQNSRTSPAARPGYRRVGAELLGQGAAAGLGQDRVGGGAQSVGTALTDRTASAGDCP